MVTQTTYVNHANADGCHQLQLSDAFIDLLLDSERADDSVFNDLERHVYDKITNVLQGSIQIEGLPRLPVETAELLDQLNDPEIMLEHIVPKINNDPALASEFLRLANSAYFNIGNRKIHHINEAVVVVGLDGLKSMLSNILLKPVMNIRPIYFKMFGKQIWDHSQNCAHQCSRLARHFKTETFYAYFIGMVHDIGKIAIFQIMVESFKAFDPDIVPRPHIFAKIISQYGIRLSHLIATNWKFPDIYLTTLREQYMNLLPTEMSPLGRILHAGNLITEAKVLLENGRLTEEEAKLMLLREQIEYEFIEKFLNPVVDDS